MAIAFLNVRAGGVLRDFSADAPDGAVIGIIGENGSGQDRLLRLAAGLEQPEAGRVEASGPARYIAAGLRLDFPPMAVLAVDHAFASLDAVTREIAAVNIHALRRCGSTILLASHEDDLVRRLADEVWWLRDGLLAGRGDPGEILARYRRHVAERVRAWGEGSAPEIAPTVRRGDGRAEILAIQTIGESGSPTMVWRSGEQAEIRVRVRFREAVADPVIGIMIRTRIGLNVYGTNTELERLKLGPCAAGETLVLSYSFRCDLCPEEYTLTVASHDPDGVWHDWLEDAVAFSVTDDRYTAGVANLRARAGVVRRG